MEDNTYLVALFVDDASEKILEHIREGINTSSDLSSYSNFPGHLSLGVFDTYVSSLLINAAYDCSEEFSEFTGKFKEVRVYEDNGYVFLPAEWDDKLSLGREAFWDNLDDSVKFKGCRRSFSEENWSPHCSVMNYEGTIDRDCLPNGPFELVFNELVVMNTKTQKRIVSINL